MPQPIQFDFPFKLRPYQEDQFCAIMDHCASIDVMAQVISPTGSGKTVLFFKTIYEQVKHGSDTPKVFLIVQPRLALISEQQMRFTKIFGGHIRVAYFNSNGDPKREGVGTSEISTTNIKEIKEEICNCKKYYNKHLVIFTTYDSVGKLRDIKFDSVFFDEAHNLVPLTGKAQTYSAKRKMVEAFNNNSLKVWFYTATPIHDPDQEFGMNNPIYFGPVISKVLPFSLIDKGYIVEPILHFIDFTTPSNAKVSPVSLVGETYKVHKERFHEMNMDNFQMLVTTRGVATDQTDIEKNITDLYQYIDKETVVVMIDAKKAMIYDHFNAGWKTLRYTSGREKALRYVERMGKYGERNVILVHYDTLAEGIDISTLSSVLFMRKPTPTAFVQTMGRVGRPHFTDIDYNNGVGVPKNFDERLKKGSIISCPIINGNLWGEFGYDKTLIDMFNALIEYDYDINRIAHSLIDDGPLAASINNPAANIPIGQKYTPTAKVISDTIVTLTNSRNRLKFYEFFEMEE